MQRRFLLLFIVCFVDWIAAFDIEKTALSVSVKGSEITVTVPENREVVSVFFSTELSDKCTSSYTFVNNLNSSSSLNYQQDIKKELKSDDEIRIIGVFQTADQVIRKTYDFKIDSQGNGIKQDISEIVSPECYCIPSQTQKRYILEKCSGTRIFSEDFEADFSKWNNEVRSRISATAPIQEFVAYTKDENNCQLKDGQLHINAIWAKKNLKGFKLKDCTSRATPNFYKQECGFEKKGVMVLPPVYSAKLHTKGLFSFQFGRVEIRARFPVGDWLFPYLILQPVNKFSEDPYVNHIRIAYARGNIFLQDKHNNNIGKGSVFGSAILWSPDGRHTEYKHSMSMLPDEHYGTEFHNYTMIWRRDRIIFKVDGLTYGTITDQKVLQELSLHECFIVLGLTVGGAVNFPDDYVLEAHKLFKNTDSKAVSRFTETVQKNTWTQPSLVVDHVHVYAIHENED